MKYSLDKGTYESNLEKVCLSLLFSMALILMILVIMVHRETVRSTLEFTLAFFKQGFESMLK